MAKNNADAIRGSTSHVYVSRVAVRCIWISANGSRFLNQNPTTIQYLLQAEISTMEKIEMVGFLILYFLRIAKDVNSLSFVRVEFYYERNGKNTL